MNSILPCTCNPWLLPPGRAAWTLPAQPRLTAAPADVFEAGTTDWTPPTRATMLAAAAPSQDQSSALGLKALRFAGTRPNGWGGMCLSWVRNAVEWAAGKGDHQISLLNAGSAEEARQKAAAAGILRKGNPPPGAIIYFKPGTYGMDARYGHIAVANPDGKTFRGSSSALGGQEVGDLKYPRGARENVYWTMPEWLLKASR